MPGGVGLRLCDNLQALADQQRDVPQGHYKYRLFDGDFGDTDVPCDRADARRHVLRPLLGQAGHAAGYLAQVYPVYFEHRHAHGAHHQRELALSHPVAVLSVGRRLRDRICGHFNVSEGLRDHLSSELLQQPSGVLSGMQCQHPLLRGLHRRWLRELHCGPAAGVAGRRLSVHSRIL